MEDQEQRNDYSGDKDHPIPSQVIPEDGRPYSQTTEPKGEHQATPTQEQLDRDLVKWTRGLARWTKALAICTAALVVAAGLQFWAMQGQLTEMKTARESGDKTTTDQLRLMQQQTTAMQQQLDTMKAANEETERAITATNRLAEEAGKSATETQRLADAETRSAVASQRLAEAAVQANGIARESFVSRQSASISVLGVEIKQYSDTTGFGSYIGTVRWSNSGNSSPKNLRIRVGCIDSNKYYADPYMAIDKKGAGILRLPDREWKNVIAPPHQTIELGECYLSYRKAVMNMSGALFWYIVGRASYSDSFNPKIVHVLELCYMFLGFGSDAPSVEVARNQVSLCDTHNCSDNTCDKQTKEAAIKDEKLPIPPLE